MSLNANLPGARQPLVDVGGVPSRPFYVFFQSVATTLQSLSDQIGDVTTTPSESPISENANVIGAYSIYTQGVLKAGIVRVLLQGDVQTPGNTQYYGSDGTGERGWYAVSDALDSTTNITLSVGADGVTTFDLADLANSGTGAALVKLTRDSKGRISGTSSASTSDLAEGSNLYFTNARAAAASPVQIVNGKTGTVSLTAADVGAATTAQGAKADSAVQSIVAGTGVAVDNTDPRNPVVSATGSGSGDVVGPASATDSSVALFDGTTGKLLKDGGSLGAAVRTAVLTGLSTATSAVIAATDTVLGALGKLQAQITDNLLPVDFIEGLQPFWSSATSVGVRAGSAYIQGSGKVVRAASDLSLSGLALTASAWSHLYVYASSGVLALEASSTVPGAAYSGTARSKTGDTSRRYVGSVLTDASGNIYKFAYSDGVVMFLNSIADAPFLVISTGRATTATNIACAGCVPVTAKIAVVIMATPGGTADAAIGNSDMTGALSSTNYLQYVGVGVQTTHFMPLDSSQRFSYRMTATTTTSGFFARVCGYIMER